MTDEKATIAFDLADPGYLGTTTAITAADLDRVFTLYLPFLGPTAYSLYQFMASEVAAGADEWADHNLVLDTLTLSGHRFERARRALEAVGLLRTSYQAHGASRGYTYLLRPALNAHDFFAEPLLASLLYTYVGDARFQQLQTRFGPQGRQIAASASQQDISAKFIQVYQRANSLSAPAGQLTEPTGTVTLADSAGDFDYQAMMALVHGTKAEKLAADQHFIMVQQVLYGLNEQEMATAITANINLDDQKLNRPALLAYLSQRFDQQRQPTLDQRAQAQARTADSEQAAVDQAADSTAAALRPEQAALYEAANGLAPLDFLADIKAQQHTFVTDTEKRILTSLVDRQVLPSPVINILTFHLLYNMNQDNLSKALVESIAASWAKAHVQTAQAAVAEIMQHQQKAKGQQRPQQRRSYKQRPLRQEPQFAAENQQQPADGQEEAALADLRQLKF
ncbi:DnaD domain protein [Leuconostocaceae bacterium ESL0958]|nr:DnaD domain protein [Leuconostocaceae bacterium ESL0958]